MENLNPNEKCSGIYLIEYRNRTEPWHHHTVSYWTVSFVNRYTMQDWQLQSKASLLSDRIAIWTTFWL